MHPDEKAFQVVASERGVIAYIQFIKQDFGNAKWCAWIHHGPMRVSFSGGASRDVHASIRRALRRYELFKSITGIHFMDANWRRASLVWSRYLHERTSVSETSGATKSSLNGSANGSEPSGGELN